MSIQQLKPEQKHILNAAAEILPQWYSETARLLPWRMDRDPYRVWISEIMLQQTRISAVLEYYARFMEELPDLESLADCSEEKLMKLWQGLGYYSRARNLKKAAMQIRENGVFPSDYASIRALPGIGDYTAGAIASISFGIPVPAVDGNVLRVMTRLLGDSRDIAEERTKKAFRELLKEYIPAAHPGEFNQAVMELGETVCLPNGDPLCDRCPMNAFCTAKKECRTGELPVKSGVKERRTEARSVLLLFREHRVLLHKRPDKGLLAGLWEYPNVPEAETLPDGLPRISDGLEIAAEGKHIFSHIEWHMKSYCMEAERELLLPETYRWASLEELDQIYAVPNAFRFAERTVREYLADQKR